MPKRKIKGRKTVDFNKLARIGIHFCASCGKRMKRHHYTGHCKKCRDRGIG